MTRRSTMPPFSCFLGTCYNLDVISSLSPLLEAGCPRSMGFSGSPSRGKYLYSLSCREDLFSDMWDSAKCCSRKPTPLHLWYLQPMSLRAAHKGVAWERRRIYVH